MRHVIHSHSDIGKMREENQDSMATLVLADDFSLLVVADGMGGYAGGSVASSLVTSTMLSELNRVAVEAFRENPHLYLRAAILAANAAVNREAREKHELRDMGSTVVAAVVIGDHAYVAHVGDSRAYLLREGVIRQITEDHTVVQDLVRAGYVNPEDAVYHPSSGILTRCLGQMDMPDPVFAEVIELLPGDRILLCSDGLSGMLEDDEIAEVVFHETAEDAAGLLVGMANEAGGFDNITVVLFACGDLPEGARAWPVVVGTPLYRESLSIQPIDEPTTPFKFATRDKAKLHDTMTLSTVGREERADRERMAWLWPILIGLAIISIGLFVWYFVGTGS